MNSKQNILCDATLAIAAALPLIWREDGRQEICVPFVAPSTLSKYGESFELQDILLGAG
jgi:hypothetical protein